MIITYACYLYLFVFIEIECLPLGALHTQSPIRDPTALPTSSAPAEKVYEISGNGLVLDDETLTKREGHEETTVAVPVLQTRSPTDQPGAPSVKGVLKKILSKGSEILSRGSTMRRLRFRSDTRDTQQKQGDKDEGSDAKSSKSNKSQSSVRKKVSFHGICDKLKKSFSGGRTPPRSTRSSPLPDKKPELVSVPPSEVPDQHHNKEIDYDGTHTPEPQQDSQQHDTADSESKERAALQRATEEDPKEPPQQQSPEKSPERPQATSPPPEPRMERSLTPNWKKELGGDCVTYYAKDGVVPSYFTERYKGPRH